VDVKNIPGSNPEQVVEKAKVAGEKPEKTGKKP
jgi:hypothetical protein